MAREWSLLETRALVEEHIVLKQQEGSGSHTASEHWNKVAKKMQEQGFTRSHRSCNKRWYRLEQYEVQIFSFNIEDGKSKNYWDLTRAERLEHRIKWPQLPTGDGIDKEMFESLKRLLHQSGRDTSEAAMTHPCVEKNEVVAAGTEVGSDNRHSALAPALDISLVPLACHEPVPLHPLAIPAPVVIFEFVAQPKPSEVLESKEPAQKTWAASNDQPLSPQEHLDGFKLQAREQRRRRAVELRRNHRTVPYNSTNTTFMKANKQSSPTCPQTPPPAAVRPIAEVKQSAITKAAPSSGTTNKSLQGELQTKDLNESRTPKEQNRVQKEHLNFSTSSLQYKVNTNPISQCSVESHRLQQLPIGSNSVLQVQPKRHHSALQESEQDHSIKHQNITQQGVHDIPTPSSNTHLPLLQSINSHLPLLQQKEGHMSQQPLAETRYTPLASLEDHMQVILGKQPNSMKAQISERRRPMKHDIGGGHLGDHRIPQRYSQEEMGPTASLLSAAIGGLEVQLGALVNLLQTKHTAEKQFKDKLLLFAECMVMSLQAMAQASGRTGT